MSRGRLKSRDYPGRFVPLDTWAVRLSPGPKALLVLALSLSAFWTRSLPLAAGLFAAVGVLYLSSGLGRAFQRDAKLFLYQFPLLLVLYALLSSPAAALERASTVAAQISCSVLPGLWLQRTTSPGDASRALRRILPGRSAFMLFTSLRFLPVILRDVKTIYTLQVLRGAPIRGRQMLHPRTMFRGWSALARHVGLPVMVHILKLAREASLAARARGLDRRADPLPSQNQETRP